MGSLYRNVAQVPLDYSMFKNNKGIFAWCPPGAIIFGNGSVAKVGPEAKRLGAEAVTVCTDAGIVKAGVAQKVITSLEGEGLKVTLFDQCEQDPSVETVERGIEAAKGSDMIIAVGGGSSIDAAKAIAIMCTNEGKIMDYGGCDKIKVAPLPIIAIPTAAGTGAEVTPFAVITDKKRCWKQPVGGSFNIAPLVICDPELTMSLPSYITAAVGMDALTHAIEGYVSRCVDPISEPILEKAITLLYKAIRPAVYRGDYDKDARYDMMLGSMLAGVGFITAGLGISHCMAHPLGAHHHVPHGVANALCLPVVMEYNYGAWPERFAMLSELLGCDTRDMDVMSAARLSVDCIYNLLEDMPIPPLSKYGVTEESLDILCRDALKGGDRSNNPRATEYEDYMNLYHKVMELKE